MLSLHPGSSCDICFEPYAHGEKGACALKCGHVFCTECINKCIEATPPLCPLCRVTFEFEDCIELQLKPESVVGPSLADEGSAEEIQTAQKIWTSILNISQNGASEPVVRQLVQDGEAFFKQRHDDIYTDLKAVFQIVNHLYDVKQKARAKQNATKQTIKELEDKAKSLEASNTELKKEKDGLEKALVKANELHRHEADLASAVEASLRTHFIQAKEKEGEMAQLLKKVQLENADMRSELDQLRRGTARRNVISVEDPGKDTHEFSSSFTLPSGTSFDVDDSAAIDPSLYRFLKPMLGGHDNITSIINGMKEELSDESQPSSDAEEPEPFRSRTPDYPIKPAKVEEIITKPSSEALSKAFLKPIKPEPSGLSRTAPYKDQHRRERSHSTPSQPPSRAQSPFKNMVKSAVVTPPIQTSAEASNIFPSVRANDSSAFLQSRLQDILTDKHSPTSSAPSFAASNLSASFTSGKSGSPPNHEPSGVSRKMSSASAQAKVLEDERKRRRGEELEHRRMQLAETDRELRRPSAPIPVPVPVSSSSASGQAARSHQTRTSSSFTQQYGQTPPSAYSPQNPSQIPTSKPPAEYGTRSGRSHQHFQAQAKSSRPGNEFESTTNQSNYASVPPTSYTQPQTQAAPPRQGNEHANGFSPSSYAPRSGHLGPSPSQEHLHSTAQRYNTSSSSTRASSIPVKKAAPQGYSSIPNGNPSPTVYT